VSGALFRLPRAERLEAARRWVGATVDVTVGRQPEPESWHRYRGVQVVAAAVPMTGTFADVMVVRRVDGRVWRIEQAYGRQKDPVDTDSLALSLADVREIHPSFT
jgi:hypothetical protein